MFVLVLLALGLGGCGDDAFGAGWAFLGIMGGGFLLLIGLVVRYFVVAAKANKRVRPATEILDPWGDYPSRSKEDEGQQPQAEAGGGHAQGDQTSTTGASNRHEG